MAIGRVSAVIFGAMLLLHSLCSCYGSTEIPYDPTVTNLVTFQISIDNCVVGNIVFGIFYDLAPITVLNFISLCVGNTTDPNTGQPRTYNNSSFHRTIRNFMIQGGDIEGKNGWGTASIYNGSFADEPMLLKHHGNGWIGMANAGPDTNGCQIYITCVQTSWLDGGHVLFGKVISGMDVVRKIEYNPTDQNDRPIKPVIITGCTSEVLTYPFTVPKTPVDCN